MKWLYMIWYTKGCFAFYSISIFILTASRFSSVGAIICQETDTWASIIQYCTWCEAAAWGFINDMQQGHVDCPLYLRTRKFFFLGIKQVFLECCLHFRAIWTLEHTQVPAEPQTFPLGHSFGRSVALNLDQTPHMLQTTINTQYGHNIPCRMVGNDDEYWSATFKLLKNLRLSDIKTRRYNECCIPNGAHTLMVAFYFMDRFIACGYAS